VRCV
ncbi:unnamed protein product, partial [Callosobruchus maculatus]|jgi:hypothetical protein